MKTIDQIKDDLITAYNTTDEAAFAVSLVYLTRTINFLNSEVIRYRDALNKIAWPTLWNQADHRTPKRIAIETLDISKVVPPT